MSTPTPATPASEPIWLRLLRSVLAIFLASALTIICALAVISCVPTTPSGPDSSSDSGSNLGKIALTIVALLGIFLPVILLFVAARKRWLTWTVLGVGCLIVAPVLAWLSWDDPAIRQPVSLEEFSPAFPGAEQSYAVLMQYSRQTPSKEAEAFAATKMAVPAFGLQPVDAAKWVDFVSVHRAGLEQDWATLAPQRRWLGELAAFDRIGDITPASYDYNVMQFQAWRTLTYHLCAIATLQALDGHGDDAVATLVPLLEVSRKIQVSSRTLVRNMSAEVTERMTLQTAVLVLDRSAVSPAARNRLSTALANENAPALARRLVLVDYVHFAPLYFSVRLGDAVGPDNVFRPVLRPALNFVSGLLVNPNATLNLYGDYVRELAALAEARELGKLSVRARGFYANTFGHPGLKNLVGRLLIGMAMPAYEKVLETHWANADLRETLRKRLATPS
jgi:hypothetical protein